MKKTKEKTTLLVVPLERKVRCRSDSRVSSRMLPGCPMFCSIGKDCVYRVSMICDDPRNNKGNGDAKCHRMNNRDVLAALSTMPNVKLTGGALLRRPG